MLLSAAFTAPTATSFRSHTNPTKLTSRRPTHTAAKRRPRPAIQAMFLWSSGFEDEHHDDETNEDTGETHELKGDSDSYDENILGDAWRRPRAGTGESGGGGAGNSVGVAAGGDAGHGNDVCDRLHRAVRQYTSGPDDMDRLRELATDCAADAFRRIVMGILGTIPGDAYEIVITSDRGGLSRLMQSSLSTGYALRNAEVRMLLNESMDSKGSGGRKGHDSEGEASMHDLFVAELDSMRSVPRRGKVDASSLDGTVRWWDSEREVKQEMVGSDYIARLEAENELLRERLAATQTHDSNSNRLMNFMRTLNPHKIASLQADLSADAISAFKQVVNHVLGDLSPTRMQMTYTTSRDYLAQLTFWCLLVGYSIRNFEKRIEMTKIFDSTQAFAEPTLRDLDFPI